jgi:hypothetical protein
MEVDIAGLGFGLAIEDEAESREAPLVLREQQIGGLGLMSPVEPEEAAGEAAGQHSLEVLEAWGFSDAEIRGLRESKAIG